MCRSICMEHNQNTKETYSKYIMSQGLSSFSVEDFSSAHSKVNVDVLTTPARDVCVLKRLDLSAAPEPEGGANATIGYGIEKALERIHYCLHKINELQLVL